MNSFIRDVDDLIAFHEPIMLIYIFVYLVI